jgi:hypothetical protein
MSLMNSPMNSPWVAAHGKLWYDDKPYRLAWIIWPQALAAALVLWFWFAPSATTGSAQWAKPMDSNARVKQLFALRNDAKTNQSAMDALERAATGGEPIAQFYYATLFAPDLKLSSIVTPDANKAVGWYQRSASQGNQDSAANLAIGYYFGTFGRQDNTRACFYAKDLKADAFANALRIKGDCFAQGLGGTKVDYAVAAAAYEPAAKEGNSRAAAALGYFYENGLGGRGQGRRARPAQSRFCLQCRLARPAARSFGGGTADRPGAGAKIRSDRAVTDQSSGAVERRVLAEPAAAALREGLLLRSSRWSRYDSDVGRGAAARPAVVISETAGALRRGACPRASALRH